MFENKAVLDPHVKMQVTVPGTIDIPPRDMRNAYRVSVGEPQRTRRDHYGDPGTQAEMILKLTLNKQYTRVLTGIMWLGKRSSSSVL